MCSRGVIHFLLLLSSLNPTPTRPLLHPPPCRAAAAPPDAVASPPSTCTPGLHAPLRAPARAAAVPHLAPPSLSGSCAPCSCCASPRPREGTPRSSPLPAALPGPVAAPNPHCSWWRQAQGMGGILRFCGGGDGCRNEGECHQCKVRSGGPYPPPSPSYPIAPPAGLPTCCEPLLPPRPRSEAAAAQAAMPGRATELMGARAQSSSAPLQ